MFYFISDFNPIISPWRYTEPHTAKNKKCFTQQKDMYMKMSSKMFQHSKTSITFNFVEKISTHLS